MAIRFLRKPVRWVAGVGLGFIILVALMGCLSQKSTLPEQPDNPPDGQSNTNQDSLSIFFEALILFENNSTTLSWVRVCDQAQRPYDSAKIMIGTVPFRPVGQEPMLFFKATCAHYEAQLIYRTRKVYHFEIQVSNAQYGADVRAPVFKDVDVIQPTPLQTVARNEPLTLSWTYPKQTPERVFFFIVSQVGERLFASSVPGTTNIATLSSEDLLTLPPGQHTLWILFVNGKEMLPEPKDPSLQLGSGFWIGVLKRIELYFI